MAVNWNEVASFLFGAGVGLLILFGTHAAHACMQHWLRRRRKASFAERRIRAQLARLQLVTVTLSPGDLLITRLRGEFMPMHLVAQIDSYLGKALEGSGASHVIVSDPRIDIYKVCVDVTRKEQA